MNNVPESKTEVSVVFDPNRRHEFIALIEVRNANLNGDPDADNYPRKDPLTEKGLQSAPSFKRKQRDNILAFGEEWRLAFNKHFKESTQGVDIYVKPGSPLQDTERNIFRNAAKEKIDPREVACQTYFDVRMFGGVLINFDPSKVTPATEKAEEDSTKKPEDDAINEINEAGLGKRGSIGHIRGPWQLSFGYSHGPITVNEVKLTRLVASTRTDSQTFGSLKIVPYGLYEIHGFYSPGYAAKNGVNKTDMALFWESLLLAFDLNHASGRGDVFLRDLFIFSHETSYGNAPTQRLFEMLSIKVKENVTYPRNIEDFEINVPTEETLPKGVSLTTMDELSEALNEILLSR